MKLLSVFGMTLFSALLFSAHPGAAHASQCRYDATGPGGQPDGEITVFHPSGLWWEADAWGCYQVSDVGPFSSYAGYFPKCDVDESGTVSLEDALQIYYHVHPGGQPNSEAANACIEWYESTSYVYCPADQYDHFAAGVDAILAAYPETDTLLGPHAIGGTVGQIHAGSYSYEALECHNESGAKTPLDIFDALNGCYNAETLCENLDPGNPAVCVQHYSPYPQFWILFDHPTESSSIIADYQQVAEPHGVACIHNTVNWWLSTHKPGFHLVDRDGDTLTWRVAVVANCNFYGCSCSLDMLVTTNIAEPGVVHELEYNVHNTGSGCAALYDFPA